MASGIVHKRDWVPSELIRRFIERNSDGRSGAINIFIGHVKRSGVKGDVKALYLEAYEEVASEELRRIADEVRERYGLNDVEICHAVGEFGVGEPIVYVAIAAPSRKNMYEAMKAAIEGYKTRPPIFKKEIYSDGSSEWI